MKKRFGAVCKQPPLPGRTVGLHLGAVIAMAMKPGSRYVWDADKECHANFEECCPSLSLGCTNTARDKPQVIMAGITPSAIDINDTEADVFALVRPDS